MDFVIFVGLLIMLPQIFCVQLDLGLDTDIDLKWPFNLGQKFKEPTNAPVAIDTKSAKQMNFSPVEVVLFKDDQLQFVNTEYSAEIQAIGSNTKSYATGGIMGNKTYTFEKIEFFWSGNSGGSCSHVIDCKTRNLEFELVFYYAEYGNFDQAKEYPGGLVILSLDAGYEGVIDNPQFTEFVKAASSISSPASPPVPVRFGSGALKWLYPEGKTFPGWFSYPGCYIDLDTQKFYYTLSVIVIQNDKLIMSQPQWKKSFGGMKSRTNSPMTSALQSFDLGSSIPLIAGKFAKILKSS